MLQGKELHKFSFVYPANVAGQRGRFPLGIPTVSATWLFLPVVFLSRDHLFGCFAMQIIRSLGVEELKLPFHTDCTSVEITSHQQVIIGLLLWWRLGAMMHKAGKVLPSGLWTRVEGVVGRAGEQGLWQRSAMAMATKVDGSKKSGIDEGSPGANPAEREAFKSDMDASYGDAYSTRSADEGYGERYGEAVKVVLEKKQDTTELQRGETAERDQNEETVKHVQYDTSQGEHVKEKEVSRHSK